MTTITLASLETTLISTPSSVKPLSLRSIHSLVMGRPWIEESAVPSIEPLTSLPDGRVPLRMISRLPQNQPVKYYDTCIRDIDVCFIRRATKVLNDHTEDDKPLGLADSPKALRGTPKHLATSKIAESHSF